MINGVEIQMLEKRDTLEDEACWRRLVIAEEDRLRLRAHPWCGAGYRWFKSPDPTPWNTTGGHLKRNQSAAAGGVNLPGYFPIMRAQ